MEFQTELQNANIKLSNELNSNSSWKIEFNDEGKLFIKSAAGIENLTKGKSET